MQVTVESMNQVQFKSKQAVGTFIFILFFIPLSVERATEGVRERER